MRIAIIASHPVQYQVPLFRLLADQPNFDARVFYCSDFGARRADFDRDFNRSIDWSGDGDLFAGYRSSVLMRFFSRGKIGFWRCCNPDIAFELLRGRFDVVWVNGWDTATAWIVFAVAFLLRIPILLRAESPANQEVRRSGFKLFLKKIVFGKLLFPRIAGFLYIGAQNKEFYRIYGVPEARLFFTPYAVDIQSFFSKADLLGADKDVLRDKLGLPKAKKIILFVGKLISKKRPLDLLRAYAIATTPDRTLVFVGEGNLRFSIELEAGGRRIANVFLAGFKSQSELPEYYAAADIFVLPSQAGETWGLVVNEAMCFGLPVITSDIVGCAADLVHPGQNGYTFALGDVKALSDKIDFLLKDDALRSRFGKKSQEIIANYSYEKDVEGILAAVLRVVRVKK